MDEKRRLRAQIREARAARAPSPFDPQHLPEVPHWQRIGAYLAIPGEPDPAPLIAARADLEVVLPRIEGDHLTWVAADTHTTFETGPFGVWQPCGPGSKQIIATVDALLIPALAVDAHGNRLGQGGGYYDRFLAELPDHRAGGPLRIAVVFDDEVVGEIPVEPHDARMDAAITPHRFVRFT